MYARIGRPSIPPERLLKAQLLMALYSVRSERMLFERIQYDMLFRWFLDMSMTESVFDASSFSRNRGHERVGCYPQNGKYAMVLKPRSVTAARGVTVMSVDARRACRGRAPRFDLSSIQFVK